MIMASPHFSIDELTFSETAIRHGIDNTPDEKQKDNLLLTANLWRTCVNILVIILYMFLAVIVALSLIHFSALEKRLVMCVAWLVTLRQGVMALLMTLYLLLLIPIFLTTKLFWSMIDGFTSLFVKMKKRLDGKR